MSLDKDQIQKLATLSRIAIDDATLEAVSERFSSVLDLVDKLQAADTLGVEPMAHPLQTTQLLRDDIISEPNHQEAFQKLSENIHDGLYLVPKVIE
ncbi:MAG: Asp-tRNA(Asn)/Glu-tRNA(Gln) amidotransferase subunit GatC [Porticoccaceae bacterium]|nr:Asp-tRNA(Asn)/Glu-tRNA(Gln) amidotransferase subunit GatC [Porticoccaceae bacterium]